MKGRNVVIYFVVFALLGGYFYYFEVIKKREENRLKEAEKKIFALKSEDVQEIKIEKGSEKIVLVKKENQWAIKQPIETEVDVSSLKAFLGVITNLDAKKWIPLENNDLKPFGLDTPSLTLEMSTQNSVYKLAFGSPNPTEDGYFGTAFVNNTPSGKERVFLAGANYWGIINKGLYELRRKDLASFENPQVRSITFTWRKKDQLVSFSVVREAETWKIPTSPDFKVRKSKIDNILDQIRWLRAQKFLSSDKVEALDNPVVTLFLDLANADSLQIQLAQDKQDKQDDGTKPTAPLRAFSSHLPYISQVDGYILTQLPEKPEDLEDKSVFRLKNDEIGKIVWRNDKDILEFIRSDDKDKWKLSLKEGKENADLKEPWRARSLLWELSEIEYEQKKSMELCEKEKFSNSLLFFKGSEESPSMKLSWSNGNILLAEYSEPRDEKDCVAVSPERIKALEAKLKDLGEANKGSKSKR